LSLGPATEYAGEDADICLRLWVRLRPRLAQENAARVYERVDKSLVSVIGRMERRGKLVHAPRNLALVAAKRKRLDTAKERYQQAVKVLEECKGRDADSRAVRDVLLVNATYLANLLRDTATDLSWVRQFGVEGFQRLLLTLFTEMGFHPERSERRGHALNRRRDGLTGVGHGGNCTSAPRLHS